MKNDFVRRSPDASPNAAVIDTAQEQADHPKWTKSNVAWLGDQAIRSGVLLLGGTSVDHFRIRFAQSRYRDDLAPSFWSCVGIAVGDGRFITAPVHRIDSVATVPTTNGVRVLSLKEFDDTERFPNIAILRFAVDADQIVEAVKSIARNRAVLDIPSMLIAWLGYVWATDDSSNPLRSGVGLPGAALVETALASLGVEVSPGQTTSSSSPEVFWQAARWWSGFYSELARTDQRNAPPSGSYLIRQWAAAAVGVRDDMDSLSIRPSSRTWGWSRDWKDAAAGRRETPRRRR